MFCQLVAVQCFPTISEPYVDNRDVTLWNFEASSNTQSPKPTVYTTKECWITEETQALITISLVGAMRNTCRICGLEGSSTKRTRVHIKQHYVRNFCSCGYNTVSRDSVLGHNKKCCLSNKIVYQVDCESYQAFCAAMNWRNPPEYKPCVPTKLGAGDESATDHMMNRQFDEWLEQNNTSSWNVILFFDMLLSTLAVFHVIQCLWFIELFGSLWIRYCFSISKIY